MNKRVPTQALCGLLMLAAGTAQPAEIYRWTDDQGRVHYSQTPPTQGLATRMDPAPGTQGARLATEGMATFNAQRDEQRNSKREAAHAEQETAAREAATCAAAQKRLAALDARTARRLMIPQDDGSMARASEEQFQALRAEAQQIIDKSC